MAIFLSRRAVQKALLLAIGVLIAFGICEIIVRFSGVAPQVAYVEKWRLRLSENPKIGYEMIPHLDSRGKSVQFFGYNGRSNSMGFRDYEHELRKPEGVTRVIVLGDSLTAGLWIDKDEDVFPSQLERVLNQESQRFEVFNFGVLGYNTMQEVETLKEKGLQFSPDVVVVAYCLNDRWQDDGGGYYHLLLEANKGDKISTVDVSPYLSISAAYRFLRFRVFPQLGLTSAKAADRRADFFAKDTVRVSLQNLRTLAQREGFSVLLVVFPDFTTIEAGTEEYGFADQHQAVAEWASRFGFQHLDLLEPMRRCKEQHSPHAISFDRFHARPSGYRCAAEETAKVLKRMVQ